jgi:uncharacterized repeat protein (TIGR03847 family)
MNPSFDLERPDHFTAGAVGPPGQRVFYLQAHEGDTLVTLKSEKEQVRALGEYLAELLGRLPDTGEAAPGDSALREPIDPAWAVGSIGIGYDEPKGRVVVVLTAAAEEEEEEGAEGSAEDAAEEAAEEAASARFAVTRAQAAAFVERARALMRAGRPICPMCASAIDPGGHVCPRSNGHVVSNT